MNVRGIAEVLRRAEAHCWLAGSRLYCKSIVVNKRIWHARALFYSGSNMVRRDVTVHVTSYTTSNITTGMRNRRIHGDGLKIAHGTPGDNRLLHPNRGSPFVNPHSAYAHRARANDVGESFSSKLDCQPTERHTLPQVLRTSRAALLT